jgi:hypothetical protein
LNLATPDSSFILNGQNPVKVDSTLHLGSSAGHLSDAGVNMVGSATMPSFVGGTVNVFQFGTLFGIRTNFFDHTQILAYTNAVDGSVPASDFVGHNHAGPAADAEANYDDSPAVSFSRDKFIAVFESFTDYLMFMPDGGDSIWVPLRVLGWSWGGVAVGTPGGTYSLVTGTNPPSNVVGQRAYAEPQWNSYIPSPPHWLSIGG